MQNEYSAVIQRIYLVCTVLLAKKMGGTQQRTAHKYEIKFFA